ncbi:MAG: thioredoxin fold domain-containing protein [Beijerinckiaceae bacterium]
MSQQPLTRRLFCLVSAFGWLTPAMATASGLSLLMFERRGCPWCRRWHAEVGPIYPKTETGRRAPLSRIDLDLDRVDVLKLAEPVRFTPTFVLMRNGEEAARITGYHDDGAFWGLLDAMLERQPSM